MSRSNTSRSGPAGLASQSPPPGPANGPRLYDDEAELLLKPEQFPDRVTLLPNGPTGAAAASGPGATERIRIMWGQDMLRDVLDGRYRAVICGVNDKDNAHGIIAQLVNLMRTSQWTPGSVTSYAKMFQDSVSVHAAHDREPYILKYDLDSVMILALLRPKSRDHFTLADLSRGFSTVVKMLEGRHDRQPVASVSFLNARANRLISPVTGVADIQPSFETVLRTMYQAGFRGDVYPAPTMWQHGSVGVFPSYPFPEGLEHMRQGGH